MIIKVIGRVGRGGGLEKKLGKLKVCGRIETIQTTAM